MSSEIASETWNQWALRQLTENGLWKHEAQAVIEQWLAGSGEAMASRFNDVTDGYPVQMQAIVRLGLFSEASAWLKANAPQHFARPMFEGELPAVASEEKP